MMASVVIHMAVAAEINKIIKKNQDKILIGAVAPDVCKFLNNSKKQSHFLNDNTEIPNIDLFLSKYKNNLSDDFVLGYFIHIYTDYLWSKYFLSEVYKNQIITKLDGKQVKCNGNMLGMYIYNDYACLNGKIIAAYNLDLNVFDKGIPPLDDIIEEIPVMRINNNIDEVNNYITTDRKRRSLVFDFDNICNFIFLSSILILAKLDELNFYK